MTDPWIGKTIGNCKIESFIGEGAMGNVYLAFHGKLEKKVAVKFLHPALVGGNRGVKTEKRFRKEAHWGQTLSHPNIVKIHEIDKENNVSFIVMEYVQGKSLARILAEEGPLNEMVALQIAKEVVLALQVAHDNGVIHRDIKPGNILIADDGGIKLSDFGLAKNKDKMSSISQAGQVIGTIFYMSPEQAKGARKIDHRADFYALGATLYHALTGRVPYPGRTPLQVLQQHISAPLPKLSEYLPNVFPELEKMVCRLMEKKPDMRFENCQELLESIENCQESLRKVRTKNDADLKNPEKKVAPLPLWGIGILVTIVFVTAIFHISRKVNTPETPEIPEIPKDLKQYTLVIRELQFLLQNTNDQISVKQKIRNLEISQEDKIKIIKYSKKLLLQQGCFIEVHPHDNSLIHNPEVEIAGVLYSEEPVEVYLQNTLVALEKQPDNVWNFQSLYTLQPGENVLELQLKISGETFDQDTIHLQFQETLQDFSADFSISQISTRNQQGLELQKFPFGDPVIIDIHWHIDKVAGDFDKVLTISGHGPSQIRPVTENLGKAKIEKSSIQKALQFSQIHSGEYVLRVSLMIGNVVREKTVKFTVGPPQKLMRIELEPSEVILKPEETTTFIVKGFNSHNVETPFTPSWIVSGGKIFDDTKFQAGTTPGDFIIIVRDDITRIQAQATVYVRNKKPPQETGWFGEKMPFGMKRSSKVGEYVWTKDQSVMLYVPEGEFWRGSSYKTNERPIEKVYLKSYYIDKYEITWEQYSQFCTVTGYEMPDNPSWGMQKNHPVVNISWNDCKAYTQWAGKRLPTEAEWEKAAKGGFKIPNWESESVPIPLVFNPDPHRRYPWGNDPPNKHNLFRCNYVANDVWKQKSLDGYETTSPIGTFEKWNSPYGCSDMAGNVWEWCQDIYYEKHSRSANINISQIAIPLRKSLRGGSWYNHAESCRTTRREYGMFNEKSDFVGMRLTKSVAN